LVGRRIWRCASSSFVRHQEKCSAADETTQLTASAPHARARLTVSSGESGVSRETRLARARRVRSTTDRPSLPPRGRATEIGEAPRRPPPTL
jgi:hypothetical protein